MRPLVYSDTITIRTDANLRAAIDEAAACEGASASDWVRRALASVVPAPVPRLTSSTRELAHPRDEAA